MVWKPVVLDVIPVNAFAPQRIPKLVVLGVVPVRVVPPSAVVRLSARLVAHASVRRFMGAPAQPAVPADRCAPKIVRFLAVVVMRVRQLNGNPLGGWGSVVARFFWPYEPVSDVQTRCAGLVVLAPVVPAWFAGPWCGWPVVPGVIVCWTWFRSWLVV